MNEQQQKDTLLFMAWLGCKSLDELADIPYDERDYSIKQFRARLRVVGIEKDPDRIIESVETFFKNKDAI